MYAYLNSHARFSLLTALVVMGVVGTGSGMAIRFRHHWQQQAEKQSFIDFVRGNIRDCIENGANPQSIRVQMSREFVVDSPDLSEKERRQLLLEIDAAISELQRRADEAFQLRWCTR
jgi:predicted 2-oxoglutarate/Fe(II)-dependent dioxygenase YbiX